MRSLQIAIGIACLSVVYAGLAPVLRAGPIEDAKVPSIEAPLARDTNLERFRVIGKRNLFRTRISAPIAPEQEVLKESALRLKLCGTYAAEPADQSVACIDDQGTQKRRAFRIGQEITPGVRLIAVERRRAVIDNQGAREQLKMEDPFASSGNVLPPTGVSRGVPAAAPARGSSPRLSERLRKLRERAAPAAPPGVTPPSKLQMALDGAQLLPVYDENGGFGGVRLSGIRPDGPFAGIPEDTVCFEINGMKLDAAQALPTALVTHAESDACLRCRQPDGQVTTRCL